MVAKGGRSGMDPIHNAGEHTQITMSEKLETVMASLALGSNHLKPFPCWLLIMRQP